MRQVGRIVDDYLNWGLAMWRDLAWGLFLLIIGWIIHRMVQEQIQATNARHQELLEALRDRKP